MRALKTRISRKLYNAQPLWLADKGAVLEAAVAAAYGWNADIREMSTLWSLLELILAEQSN